MIIFKESGHRHSCCVGEKNQNLGALLVQLLDLVVLLQDMPAPALDIVHVGVGPLQIT